jgi:hypothetical protein
MSEITVSQVEHWLDLLYVAAEGAALRQEDRRKAREVASMLEEIRRAILKFASRSPLVLVDAAAGKSYIGLLAAKLVFEAMGRTASVRVIEQDAQRVSSSQRALERLRSSIDIEFRAADVADAGAWPERPSVVAALHACGPAADTIIERTIACKAGWLLLVPCCTGKRMEAANRAAEEADRMSIPRHAQVRRRFIQAMVDAERTLRLEANGYETEVVEFVGATVTPHNLLWRSRLVAEPARMQAAQRALKARTEPFLSCKPTGSERVKS